MAEPSQPTTSKPPDVAIEDDSDPDFDDLDDVLDQFSAASTSQPTTITTASKSQNEPTPSSSGPGRPPTTDKTAPTSSLPADITIPTGPKPNESEDEFLARLTEEMSTVMSKFSMDPAASAATPEDIAKMGQELEEFTHRMEAEGIQPEDMLKAILGEEKGTKVVDVAEKERDRRESESKSKSRSPEKSRIKDESPVPASSSSTSLKPKGKPADSFEDTIRKTMARMESSSAAATSATQKSSAPKSEEDMLAEMLRALESEGGAGGDGAGEGDLSKMFLGMMEQLTNKDMLYEPMKELSTKYPSWLADHQPPKLTQAEFDRFSRQRVIVDEIVSKFEEKGYSDEDPKSREFVWEKMQQMQGEGAPPEDLVANPFPGMGLPGLGLGEDGAEGLEDGCPTQ